MAARTVRRGGQKIRNTLAGRLRLALTFTLPARAVAITGPFHAAQQGIGGIKWGDGECRPPLVAGGALRFDLAGQPLARCQGRPSLWRGCDPVCHYKNACQGIALAFAGVRLASVTVPGVY